MTRSVTPSSELLTDPSASERATAASAPAGRPPVVPVAMAGSRRLESSSWSSPRSSSSSPSPWQPPPVGDAVASVEGQHGRRARGRLTVGVGAAVVIVIITLVCSVLVSALTPKGHTETLASASASAPRVSGTAAGEAAPTPSGIPPAGGSGATAPPEAPSAPPAGDGAAPGRTDLTSGRQTAAAAPSILVHVIGAVARPGLVTLHRGDRIVDAVSAAGGFSATADQNRLNLARVVADGDQIGVPEVGGAIPGLSGGALAGGAGGSGGSGGVSPGGAGGSNTSGGGDVNAPVSLNTADSSALQTLPHVGPALAQRIIDWRSANGPFTRVDDLKNVSGIGDKTYEALAPLVTL